ncbi:MAG TPA: hypothetical protein DEA22_03820 [Blastocatellia bacterium]|nr:hypothetical protein [Blastocatellia bacterium]
MPSELLKSIFIFTVILLSTNIAIFGQGDPSSNDTSDAKAVNIPKIVAPPEAAATGIGGEVNVRVRLDESGKLMKIEQVVGPGWVCPSVTRGDVLAIRAAVVSAVENTVFSPAMRKGHAVKASIWIGFIFPEKKPPVPGKPPPQTESENAGQTPSDSANTQPKQISGGVVNGKALKLPAPSYPPEARAAGASGKVDIEVLISEDGSVFTAKPLSGHPMLHSAARLAACKAKFSRTSLLGKVVSVKGVVTYNFVP